MIGRKLADRYEIAAELGRGGMGVVYRARDPLLNRDVAVKVIPPTQLSPDSEHRFQREAQLVAQMDHPAIVSIYDFGRHEDSLFILMPLVQGTSLRAFLRQESVLGDVLDIGIQVAEALDYSHARGVVHRDIKPENIMVSREEGVGVRVRVMDFGLARAAAESRLTKTGSLVGTLYYMSPEQVAATSVDGRADVYALGTVLYECVVGQPPFTGEAQSVLYRIVHEYPQSPREIGVAIDQELDAIIVACLAKEPGQRPQRAGEVAEALKRYRSRLHDSDRARSVTGFTRSFQSPRPALSPFVGRTKEFAELQQRLNAAVAGESQFVVVGGEPGIGKTRLLDELANLAKARQIRVLYGRSVEQGRAFPYQGFCEIIQDYFRLKETGSSPAPDLSDLAADLLSLFPMLGEIGEIRSAVGGDSKLARGGSAGPENRTQIFELLARVLTRIAAGRPLVLMLEDLHGAEVTIEALPYIVTRLGPTPTLIVGSYRTTEVERRHPLHRILDGFRGDRRFCSLSLGSFSPSDHRALAETLVGGDGIPDSLAQRLYEGTEGNPFFTKELVRSLLDSGGIARDATGQWSLSGEAGLAAEAMPATIQELVERRIERLPDELREILSLASVLGKTFDSRDLEALAKGTDVDDAIDRLVQSGLIEEQRESRGELLSFSSGVVRDVLYAGLSPRKRRSLHRKCAELLEMRHAGRLERVLAQLVHHFSQGDVPEKAVAYGLRLARASLDAFSAEEAARAAKTALGFLDEEWEGDRSLEGDARMILARAHRMAGDIEGAIREAAAAVRILELQKQPARTVAALLFAAETAWQARRTEEAVRWVARGLETARAAGEMESVRELLSLGATLANLRGEYDKANEYLDEIARLLRGSREPEAEEVIPGGGTLIVGLANPVRSIEPPATATTEESEIAGNLFETLLTTDPDGNLVPALCERWETHEAGRSFLLSLRPAVRFQGGRPLKAKDVKDSFEGSIRELPQNAPAAFAAILGFHEFAEEGAREVAGIVVHSELKLEIRLRDPLPIYPALLSDIRTGIRLKEDGGGQALGTGPFRIACFDPERVVLERSGEHWRGAPPLLEAIEFRLGLRASAMAAALRSGELDVARDLLPQDLEEILHDPRSALPRHRLPADEPEGARAQAARPRSLRELLRDPQAGVGAGRSGRLAHGWRHDPGSDRRGGPIRRRGGDHRAAGGRSQHLRDADPRRRRRPHRPLARGRVQGRGGGRSYRFRLRDDVRFHDGRRLTARDVRYSLERLLQRESAERWHFSSIRGAKALLTGEARDLAGLRIHSASELTIELEDPVAFFPALMSYDGASIIPEGSDPSGESGLEACVGTGPFRVVRFEPGRRLELERHKAYWRKGYPRSQGLVFSFGVSPKEILSGFRAGRFSLASEQASVDLVVGRWGADYPDPDTFAQILHSPAGFLGRVCGSAEVDRLVERARAETVPALRHSLYRQVEEIVAREALLLPLFHEQAYRFARPEVEGLSLSLGVPTVAYQDLRIRG